MELEGVANPVALEFEFSPFVVQDAASDEAAACREVEGVVFPKDPADGDEEDRAPRPGHAAGGAKGGGDAAAVAALAQLRQGIGIARGNAEGRSGVEEVDEVVERLALGRQGEVDREGSAQVADRAEGNDFLGAEVDAAQAGEAAVEFVDDDFMLAGQSGGLAEVGFVLGVGGAGEGHGGEAGAGQLKEDFWGDGGEAVLAIAPGGGVAHAGDAAGVEKCVEGAGGMGRGGGGDRADGDNFEEAALANRFHAIPEDGFEEGAVGRRPAGGQGRSQGRRRGGARGADLGGDLPGEGVSEGEVVDVKSEAVGWGQRGREEGPAGFNAAVRMAWQIEAGPGLATEGRRLPGEGGGGEGRGT